MAKGASTAASASSGVSGILADFQTKYVQTTPKKIKLIDGFLAYVLATGILQFIYCVLVGTFPFNSFLAGFVCTVGVFVLGGTFKLLLCDCLPFEKRKWCDANLIVDLTLRAPVIAVSLRMQINPENEFKDRSEQRAFADYLFCNIILFLVVFNFMG